MSNEEIWIDVVGKESSYQISSWGRVKSKCRPIFKKDGALHYTQKECILKLHPATKQGHLSVDLYHNGKHGMQSVHIMVLEAFVGPRPDGMEGCHNDGNAGNNYVENLRWDTHSANELDKRLHGTSKLGKPFPKTKNGEHPLAHFTKIQALEIRSKCKEARQQGYKQYSAKVTEITTEHNVSRRTILNIVREKTFKEGC